MKKKILFVTHAMELGGAERSLIGLLDAIDPERYDIDLFLLRHEGELLCQIPQYVNVLPAVPAYTVLARPMKETLKEGHFLLTFARLYGKLRAAQFNKRNSYTESDAELEYSHKYTYRLMPAIQPETEYDLAVSFLTPHYIVANRVRARRKIAWIHTDYTNIKIDIPSETEMWGAYDRIISISETVSAGFLKIFPSLRNRMTLIENILPEKLIHQQEKEFAVEEEMKLNSSVRLLSVGRYCTPKNFDNVPDICAGLLDYGLNIKWYIIGFGPDEDLIRNKISESGMKDHVILLGKKENPYPYIRYCDLYVQPSRYEGKSVTVREAQMLGKPVVITNYATSSSQLEDGVDGVIVPMDNEGCAAGLAELINDSSRIERLCENCKARDYSNSEEVKKLYRIIDDEN
ncbi:MAG: glycosyltransferase [Clostridiales bacterium]|nr:glycosyltransferase [Clostridiales bacterium]